MKLGVCSAARRGVVQVCEKVNRKINANNADFKTLHFHSLVKKKKNTQENNVSIMI